MLEHIVAFKEDAGGSQVVEWLEGIDKDVRDRLDSQIKLLEKEDFELRWLEVAKGICQARTSDSSCSFHVLFFVHVERIILATGVTAFGTVSEADIEVTRRRKRDFFDDPDSHTLPYRPPL